MTTRLLATVLSLAMVAAATGCTSMTESYAGYDRNQVWTAMVAVAETPGHYDDWFLTDNQVWQDDAAARLEIHRQIRRDLIRPGARPYRETREMDFQVNLVEDENGPAVEFIGRHLDVPAQSRFEARAYFDDVWQVLGGRPTSMPADDDDGDDSTAMPDADPADETVDVDDLD